MLRDDLIKNVKTERKLVKSPAWVLMFEAQIEVIKEESVQQPKNAEVNSLAIQKLRELLTKTEFKAPD